jgi:putative hydrolase of the HAD superfamily
MIDLSSIKVFIFDLDDTLYDESFFVQGGTRAVLEFMASRYASGYDLLNENMKSIMIEYPRSEWYQKLIERMEIPFSQELVNKMISIYRNHRPALQLYQDAQRFISEIRKRKDTFLGIITDGFVSVQRSKVTSLCLDKLMNRLIFTWEKGIEYQKPHSWSFECIENETGLTGEICCYFGNDSRKDFLAPNVLGWKTVCVSHEGITAFPASTKNHAAQVEIGSFDEI